MIGRVADSQIGRQTWREGGKGGADQQSNSQTGGQADKLAGEKGGVGGRQTDRHGDADKHTNCRTDAELSLIHI